MANNSRDVDRRAKAEALLQQQKRAEQRRRVVLIGVPAAVVVVIAAVVGVVISNHHSTPKQYTSAKDNQVNESAQVIPAFPTSGTPVVQQTPTKVPNTTGISGVVAYDTEGWPGDGKPHAGALQHDHVSAPVTYAVTPPVGGPHDGVWMNAGVYTKPIPSERAVHNLEHGAVWITYRPDLPASQVSQLQAFVGKQTLIPEGDQDAMGNATPGQANRYLDLSPWADDSLPAPIVISSWGYQLYVTSPTDPRLQQFVDTFRHNKLYTPEYGAAVDGIPTQTGGVPAADGSARANPSGSAPG